MASTEMGIRHGEILFLSELLPYYRQRGNNEDPVAVRVIGRCIQVDTLSKKVIIANQSMNLIIDIGLVADFLFQIGSLYQFIGELIPYKNEDCITTGNAESFPDSLSSSLILRARVARCVDGMDLALYEQSVKIKRAFFNK